MKFGSLFSGIGGFDLGFERAGMACAWQCEIDSAASGVLAQHWPDVKRYTDVRNIGSANAEPVNLICGGFPCQDLSVAGKRAGLAGKRSGLWFEFHRILAELTPGWVVIENVPGLLSSNGGRDFAVVLRGLVELGYGVAWRVLDAQYFGVAQRRRRVFIVGHLGDGRAAEVLFEREGSDRDTPPRRQAGKKLASDVAASLRSGGNGARGYTYDAEQGLVASALSASHGGADDNDAQAHHLVTHTLRAEGHDASEDGTGRGVPIVFESRYARNGRGAPDTIVPPLKAQSGQSGQSGKGDAAPLVGLQMNYIRKERIGDYTGSLQAQPGDAQFNGIWDRRNGVRRLMPVECERLQGFPDGWTAGQADSARYKQLGNAVEVDCAAWIGQRIYEGLRP